MRNFILTRGEGIGRGEDRCAASEQCAVRFYYMTKPLLKFKVYCRLKHGPKTPFFWCSVWRTLPQMRGHLAQLTEEIPPGFPKRRQENAFAACYSWKLTVDDKIKPEMGVITLAMAYTGASSISHECAHTAFRFCERIEGAQRGRKFTDWYREELFCSVVGEMSKQIVHRLSAFDRRKKSKLWNSILADL